MIQRETRPVEIPASPAHVAQQTWFVCGDCKKEFGSERDATDHFGEVHAVKAQHGLDREFPDWVFVETEFAATAYLDFCYRGGCERVVSWNGPGWYRVRHTKLDDYHGGPDTRYSLTYILVEINDKHSRIARLENEIANLQKLFEEKP